MYIQYSQNFKKYTQFYMLNVHNFLIVCIQCTLFVKECIQLCIFNIYKFSKNLHNSVHLM